MFGEVADYCWKRRITRGRGAGAYCGSDTRLSIVQIDLQGNIHFIVYDVFIVAVFIEGNLLK